MESTSEVDFLPFALYSTSIFVLAIVTATLTFSTTIVKLWVSRIQRLHFFVSDHLALASSTILLGSLGLIIYYVSLPVQLYGEPSAPNVDTTGRSTYLKVAFAIEMLWPTTLALSRLSILLLYRRVFFSMRLRVGVVCTMIFVVSILIMMLFGTIFQCYPVQSFWYGSTGQEQPTCINRQVFFLFSGIPNIMANVIILVLPIPEMAKLRVSRGAKVFLWAIFLLGSTATGASIARFVEVAQIEGSQSKDARTGGGASIIVEATVTLLCAYLPTLCPALWRMLPSRSRQPSSSGPTKVNLWPRAGKPSKRHFIENYDSTASRLTGGRLWPRSKARQVEASRAKPLPNEPLNNWWRSLGSHTTVKENSSLVGGIIVEETVTTTVERRSRLYDPYSGNKVATSFGTAVDGPGKIV